MKFHFECRCGADISDARQAESDDVWARVQCDKCKENYAVTISPMGVDPGDREEARDYRRGDASD